MAECYYCTSATRSIMDSRLARRRVRLPGTPLEELRASVAGETARSPTPAVFPPSFQLSSAHRYCAQRTAGTSQQRYSPAS
jgi:hypothetical protein